MTSFYIVTSYDIKCTEVFFPTALPIFISVLNTAELIKTDSSTSEGQVENFCWLVWTCTWLSSEPGLGATNTKITPNLRFLRKMSFFHLTIYIFKLNYVWEYMYLVTKSLLNWKTRIWVRVWDFYLLVAPKIWWLPSAGQNQSTLQILISFIYLVSFFTNDKINRLQ
jgi:hypothetical protein